ncbi:hypothetical protein CRG98_006885 [Punica granatum]|uniref:Uncharacterized protein n=1 Tax=Punica granatum TaxID=22663 RepID=A0A2I0KW80_PUNGR|nr:hypothetical protein CRG98_006885 [Punica granatum]
MDEENVHEVLMGLTLDQAQFLGFQQRQDKLSARLNQLTQVVERIALAPAPSQRAHQVPRRNVQVEDEADQEDEIPEEKEQPIPRRQQRVIGNNIKLKIHQFKGTSSPEEYLKHFISEFPNWLEVTIQNPHTIESEVEEAVEDVCVVMSKEKVEYADEGEKLKAQQVVSSESKLEEQRECLENIPKRDRKGRRQQTQRARARTGSNQSVRPIGPRTDTMSDPRATASFHVPLSLSLFCPKARFLFDYGGIGGSLLVVEKSWWLEVHRKSGICLVTGGGAPTGTPPPDRPHRRGLSLSARSIEGGVADGASSHLFDFFLISFIFI